MALGAELIVDDLVVLSRNESQVRAAAPAGTSAQIELRGIGIVPVNQVAGPSVVWALCSLDETAAPQRLPAPQHAHLLGRKVPMIRLPFAEDLGPRLSLWVKGLR